MAKTIWIGWGLAFVAAMALVVPSVIAQVQLPEGAAKALKTAFGKKATVENVAADVKLGPDVFCATVRSKKSESVVRVTADGTIICVEKKAVEKDLSKDAAKAVKSADDKAQVTEVVKVEIRAEADKDKKFTKLGKNKTVYAVTVTKDGKTGTLKVARDGAVISPLVWAAPVPPVTPTPPVDKKAPAVDKKAPVDKPAPPVDKKAPEVDKKAPATVTHAAGAAAPGKLVIRVACGQDKDYTDLSKVVWSADQKYSKDKKWGYEGIDRTSHRNKEGLTEMPGTDAPELYLHERWHMDNYRFDVPNGKYTVRIHMCETWSGASKPGGRTFGLKIQDKVVQPVSFDLVKEVGYRKPYVRETKDVEVTDGKLVVHFIENGRDQHPLVDGIEVIGQ